MMILVTGANGQLGQLVIKSLLKKTDAANVAAALRSPSKGASLKALGVEIRHADYDKPETLPAAFQGVDRVLLISSSEVGKRAPQHKAVIDAAKAAGVELLAYTSILHADSNPMELAAEHQQTEIAIKESGLNYAFLRNGWYLENFNGMIQEAKDYGEITSAAGNGCISAAARADYAEAAAAVLIADVKPDAVYELAGDSAFSLPELTAEVAKHLGRKVAYKNLTPSEYETSLSNDGIPAPVAHMLADVDEKAADGALFDDSKTLSSLSGHPTTRMQDYVAKALQA